MTTNMLQQMANAGHQQLAQWFAMNVNGPFTMSLRVQLLLHITGQYAQNQVALHQLRQNVNNLQNQVNQIRLIRDAQLLQIQTLQNQINGLQNIQAQNVQLQNQVNALTLQNQFSNQRVLVLNQQNQNLRNQPRRIRVYGILSLERFLANTFILTLLTPFRNFHDFNTELNMLLPVFRLYNFMDHEKALTRRSLRVPVVPNQILTIFFGKGCFFETNHPVIYHARLKLNVSLKKLQIDFGFPWRSIGEMYNKMGAILFSVYRPTIRLLHGQGLQNETSPTANRFYPNEQCHNIDVKKIPTDHSSDPEEQAFSYYEDYKENDISLLILGTTNGNKIEMYELKYSRYSDRRLCRDSGWENRLTTVAVEENESVRVFGDLGFPREHVFQNNHMVNVSTTGGADANMNYINAKIRIPVEQMFGGLFGRFKFIRYLRNCSSEYFEYHLVVAMYHFNRYNRPYAT